MTKPQKHHIVPVYRCRELGLTTSYKIDGVEFYFKENMVEVTRHQHALIHWGYKCKDLKPLLEVCNPPQYVRDMIPLGDNRDSGAAVLIARGEIEQIDNSGENHPMWKGGITLGDNLKEYEKNRVRSPEYEKWRKEYLKSPQRKAVQKKHDKKRNQTPQRKADNRRRSATYRAKKKQQGIDPNKKWRESHREENKDYAKWYYHNVQKPKNLLKKQQGTLEQFL